MTIEWPGGRRFAFTVFDDTDWTTQHNGRPIYDLLDDLGLRITKSVWMRDPGPRRSTRGETCDDPAYLDWVLDLQQRGHEIGYHHATDRSSVRRDTLSALLRFEELFGHAPRTGADHGGNRESLYAGPARLSGARRTAYRVVERVAQPGRPRFEGSEPSSPYFWGDLARERIDYWRRFTFATTDLQQIGPVLHHDPSRPFVTAWFHSSHGPRRAAFVDRLGPRALDELEAGGGVCIMYTHFGVDFLDDRGRPAHDVVAALTDLAGRGGWFAPVSEVLDHVRDTVGVPELGRRDVARLERSWIADRLRSRSAFGPSVPTHAERGR